MRCILATCLFVISSVVGGIYHDYCSPEQLQLLNPIAGSVLSDVDRRRLLYIWRLTQCHRNTTGTPLQFAKRAPQLPIPDDEVEVEEVEDAPPDILPVGPSPLEGPATDPMPPEASVVPATDTMPSEASVGPASPIGDDTVNNLSITLLNLILSKDANQNAFVSGPNVVSAMVMALKSFPQGSDARREIEELLGGPSVAPPSLATGQTPGVTVNTANAVFILKGQEPANPDYVQALASMSAVFKEFTQVAEINGWVDKQTQGMIRNVVDETLPIDLALISTLYFKGLWLRKFDVADTTDKQFTKGDGTKIQVPMMKQEEDLAYSVLTFQVNGTEVQAKAVRKDFGADGQVGAWSAIVLPPEGTGPDQLLQDQPGMVTAIQDPQWRSTTVNLELPKFKLEVGGSIREHFPDLGLNSFFTDLPTEIQSTRKLPYFDVIHKVAVACDEEGVEAAAVTGVVSVLSMPIVEQFVVDRPFLFIVGVGKLWLFTGIVNDPLA